MDDLGCPRCKTTKYRNPSLKLMVNICGHSLCESCVDLLFIKGSGTCPECNTSLRRNNFRLQLFEDAFVEKEVDIRKKILKDFNKKEEDFGSLREYNDYLEMVETIIFNLSNNTDVEGTRKMVENYKRENKDNIQKNKSKLSKDEEYIEMLIASEAEERQHTRQVILEEEKREKTKKQKNKEALIDELMFSDLPAVAILKGHQHMVEKMDTSTVPKQAPTTFSSGAKWGYSGDNPIPVVTEGEKYAYTPCEIEMLGPSAPPKKDILSRGYMNNIRDASDEEKSGGYDASLACHRALMDAFSGLFLYQDPGEFPS